MRKLLYLFIVFLTFSSCSRTVYSPYRNKMSDCGKLVLKPMGKAVLTKCGEIMWEEEGSWTRANDTIKVQFRNYWDNKVYLAKKGKLFRIVNDSIVIKPTDKIEFEK